MFTSIPLCALRLTDMIEFRIDPFWVSANQTLVGLGRRGDSKGVSLLGGRVRRSGVRLSYPLSFCDPAGMVSVTRKSEVTKNRCGPSLQYWDMPASDRLNRAIDQPSYLLDGINRQINDRSSRVAQEPIPGRIEI